MCGIFGIFGHPEAANLTYLGLHALQHRGQESAGIVTSDGSSLYAHRALGHVQDAFSEEKLAKLPGSAAIGHVRYSTAGGSGIRNAQPLAIDYSRGSLSVAHNGNLTNADELREQLEARGSIFQSSADTESVVHLVARSTQRTVEDCIVDALTAVEGAYSMVFLTENSLIAVRDPRGIRPLCLGTLRSKSGAYVIASEPTAFDLIDAELVRSIEPGEMIVIDGTGLKSTFPFAPQPTKECIFESVYFARPDSVFGGTSVYEVRKELGRRAAVEHPVEADIVIPVPDSGVPAALGFSEKAGIPFEIGLIRSHYVGRTFIEPQQSIRHFGVRLKLNPVATVLKGRRVVVVDDSIVRGTTSRKIVKMLRDAGAKEVHMRISSPPTQWPCYYGIDTPTRRELIASSHTVPEIARYLTADSLGYLSLEGMLDAVVAARKADPETARGKFCHACFSGDYSIPFRPGVKHRQLRLIGVLPRGRSGPTFGPGCWGHCVAGLYRYGSLGGARAPREVLRAPPLRIPPRQRGLKACLSGLSGGEALARCFSARGPTSWGPLPLASWQSGPGPGAGIGAPAFGAGLRAASLRDATDASSAAREGT